MQRMTLGNPETITKFAYNATNNGDDEVSGELDFSTLTALTECEMSASKLSSLSFLSTFPNTIIKIKCARNDFYNMSLPSSVNFSFLNILFLDNKGRLSLSNNKFIIQTISVALSNIGVAESKINLVFSLFFKTYIQI